MKRTLLSKTMVMVLFCAVMIFSCSGAIAPEHQHLMNENLFKAAQSGDLSGVQQAIARGANVHAAQDTALLSAAARGYLHIVKFLLTELPVGQRADVHAQNDTALWLAAMNGQVNIVRFLLIDPGLSSDQRPGAIAICEALKMAAANHRLNVVKFLLVELPEGQRPGRNARSESLKKAARNRAFDVAIYLLQLGADHSHLSAPQQQELEDYIRQQV